MDAFPLVDNPQEASGKIAHLAPQHAPHVQQPWGNQPAIKKRAKERLGKTASLTFMQKEEEQTRATMIAKKLQLYRKRNLQQSSSLRSMKGSTAPTGLEPTTPFNYQQKTASTPLQRAATPTLGTPSPHQAAPSSPPGPGSSVRIVYRNKPSTAPTRGPSLFLHSQTFGETGENMHNRHTRPALGQPDPFDSTLQSLERIWVARRAQEAEERLEDMELQDTLHMWAYNQARIEEEINRRQESFQMSSQTGKTCHKIIRRPQTAPLEDISLVGNAVGIPVESIPSIKERALTPQPSSNLVGGSSGMYTTTPGGSPLRTPTGSSPRGGALGDITIGSLSFNQPPSAGASPRDGDPVPRQGSPNHRTAVVDFNEKSTRSISLSPYDNYDSTTEKPNMRLLQPPAKRSIVTPDTEHMAHLHNKGLLQTHPESLRSTSFLNSSLDVVAGPNTIFAPSMAASVGKVSATGGGGADGGADKNKKPKPKPRGRTSNGNNKDKGKKGTRRGPIDPALLDALFPVLSVEQEVPSILRVRQMQQVTAIREAFAKQGIALPTSVIEMGLLTPEDRPYVECITDLPRPDMGLVGDFTKPRTAKKSGKKPKKADSTK